MHQRARETGDWSAFGGEATNAQNDSEAAARQKAFEQWHNEQQFRTRHPWWSRLERVALTVLGLFLFYGFLLMLGGAR